MFMDLISNLKSVWIWILYGFVDDCPVSSLKGSFLNFHWCRPSFFPFSKSCLLKSSRVTETGVSSIHNSKSLFKAAKFGNISKICQTILKHIPNKLNIFLNLGFST